ncbi:translation initiation factor IF-2-like [Elephas maximus indicus]|uniref:translation initiation factor IF-2-like n=1 Tax=Elephas maximus indicus TaxID=99487 RepID=UPI002116B8A6|nr:translation initiation factor IF-2-like [Elephas maximus indicus]
MSKTAITASNKAKTTSPRPPTSQSVTTSPKANKPVSDTSHHVQRPNAAWHGGEAFHLRTAGQAARPPLLRAGLRRVCPSRWLRVPGSGAHGRDREAPPAGGVRAAAGLGWPVPRRRPFAAPRAPIAALLARFHNKVSSSRLPNRRPEAAERPGPGAERRRRSGAKVGRGGARGGGWPPGPGGWTYSWPNFGDAGLRNRFFPKANRKRKKDKDPAHQDEDLLLGISGRLDHNENSQELKPTPHRRNGIEESTVLQDKEFAFAVRQTCGLVQSRGLRVSTCKMEVIQTRGFVLGARGAFLKKRPILLQPAT